MALTVPFLCMAKLELEKHSPCLVITLKKLGIRLLGISQIEEIHATYWEVRFLTKLLQKDHLVVARYQILLIS
jgi:hypothetical protein